MAQEKVALAERSLEYGKDGEYNVSIAKLPDSVRFALMQRTFAHIMGNEAASVEGRLKDAKNDNGTAKYDATEVAVGVHDWRMAKIESMIKGEFALRQIGPKLSSDEKELRSIARNAIIAKAQELGKPLPKASDSEKWNVAIDKYLANPKLRAVADAELARRRGFVAPDADVEELFA